VRLNPDGSFDAGTISFRTSNTLYALQHQPDSKVVVAGSFTNVSGALAFPRLLLRLQATGALDTGFNAGS
jgi:hypothetical protein